jgi:hypothetical protein
MDVLGKFLGVILAFFILCIGPLVNTSVANDATMKICALNDTQALLSKITTTGQLTSQEVGQFQIDLASHGGILDETIQRYEKIVDPDGEGGVYIAYQLTTNTSQWNNGDICKIHVQSIDYTGAEKLLWTVLRLVVPPVNFTEAGVVHE